MRLKWRDAVDRIVQNEERDATINDVTEFVTARARAATHPVFGNVVNESKNKQHEYKEKRPFPSKASGFVTQGDNQNDKIHDVSAKKLVCPCNVNHWLSRCDKFREMSLEERKTFVKGKKLCFNCLNTGDLVRSCTKQNFYMYMDALGSTRSFFTQNLPQMIAIAPTTMLL